MRTPIPGIREIVEHPHKPEVWKVRQLLHMSSLYMEQARAAVIGESIETPKTSSWAIYSKSAQDHLQVAQDLADAAASLMAKEGTK